MRGQIVAADTDAERAVIGWMFYNPDDWNEAFDTLTPEDFRDPVSGDVFRDFMAHGPGSIQAVADRTSAASVTVDRLREILSVAAFDLVSLREQVTRVATRSMRWHAQQMADEVFARAGDLTVDDIELLAFLKSRVADLDLPDHAPVAPAEPIDKFLAGTDLSHDWVAEGMIERGDRVLVPAKSGRGKSTLFRTWACQLAAGVHPVTLQKIPPAKVMIVDLENSRRQVARKLTPIVEGPGARMVADNLWVTARSDVVDITTPGGYRWLAGQIALQRPDVVLGGPIYRMYTQESEAGVQDMAGASKVRRAVLALDRLRERFGCAFVLECHPADGGSTLRPWGSSLWGWWPDVGLGLEYADDTYSETGVDETTLTVSRFRASREDRLFPRFLHQSHRPGSWPWVASDSLRKPNDSVSPMPIYTHEEMDDDAKF